MKYLEVKFSIIAVILITVNSYSQIVVTQPAFPTQGDSIVITFDATQPGASELLNYTGTVYAHTGVTVDSLGTIRNWKYVVGSWGSPSQPALTRLGANLYKLTIGYSRQFYSVTNPSEKIIKLSMVFRSADVTKQTRPDIFIDLYDQGINLVVSNPVVSVKFTDPLRSPAFVKAGETVPITVDAVELGTKISTLTLSVDGIQVEQSNTNSLTYNFAHSNFTVGAHEIKIVGVDTSSIIDSVKFIMFSNPMISDAPLPVGIKPGLNYTSPVSATLALFAPLKEYLYVIGDFNNWQVNTDYFMKRHFVTSDSVIWWISIDNVSPGVEYAFQYLVDGNIRTGDPYSDKILDPWNDQYIGPSIYPNLKPYPSGKTESIVSVLNSGQSSYPWVVTNFQKPPKEKLVIYELLVRDFSTQRTFEFLKDTLSYLKSLGITAIELMPIMEFSGNNSWGYNPIYHVAVDKAYGPANSLKSFIDLCHQNGIAVILDMVLNQADNASPLAMMWWDAANSRPAGNSPYLNPTARHPFNVFNDFNHESNATKYFVDRVNEYWLKEFKFDGFRFDLSKGFTQRFTNDVGVWGQYDQSRINILTRMANKIWEVDSTAYVILEHFADNSEETVLANSGMMLWGNMNHDYNEATMGYNSNLWGVSHLSRGWSTPKLIGYMESHDEERLMYKNLLYGNFSGSYNIKNLAVALNRIKLAAAFFFTIPGPKLMWQFGELGYDVSIDFNGRTGEKPVRWDYLNDPRRVKVYKVFKTLMDLRNNYEVFHTNNFTLDVGGYGKKITLRHPTMDVVVVGNFQVAPININTTFTKTGWWYDYFSADSIEITSIATVIPFEPGEFRLFTTVKLPAPEAGILTDVKFGGSNIVDSYQLEQNYPNPFNPSTTINYQIVENGEVTLKIYDVLGSEIKTLIQEVKNNGFYSAIWNGENNLREKVPSGIYFYSLKSGKFSETKKMVLTK